MLFGVRGNNVCQKGLLLFQMLFLPDCKESGIFLWNIYGVVIYTCCREKCKHFLNLNKFSDTFLSLTFQGKGDL